MTGVGIELSQTLSGQLKMQELQMLSPKYCCALSSGHYDSHGLRLSKMSKKLQELASNYDQSYIGKYRCVSYKVYTAQRSSRVQEWFKRVQKEKVIQICLHLKYYAFFSGSCLFCTFFQIVDLWWFPVYL